ncbi:MAG: hypothetical protein MI862_21415, partial [Desulfobacterales bacterium]|nr:hypothetical protein [Desulfobacterales bacterium]
MESLPDSYQYFIAALKHTKQKKGAGFQNNLAITVEKSEPYISKVINQKSIASFNLQNKIAEACGYEYDEFLSFGKKLARGGKFIDEIKKVVHIDPAVQILHEALEETGVEINEKQK